MTVLFVNPTGILGGAERSLLDLTASLLAADAGLRVAMILGADGPLVAEAEKLGASVRVVPLPDRIAKMGDHAIGSAAAIARQVPALLAASAELGAYGMALRSAMRALEPRVVHSNGIKAHLLTALLPLPGVPLVWHVRDFIGQRAVMAPVLRTVAWRSAALLAISRAVADDIAGALGRKDATVVYNGIDTTLFAPDGERTDLDALAGLGALPAGAARVGIVATYARWKGQSLFLEAAARAARELGRDAARFYVIGGRAYATADSQYSEEELRAEIARHGLEGVAGLVPFQARPDRAFRALDVVVHASTRPEPFGRTIAEAMACGKAVVAAKEGGASELVESGVDSIAVEPRDAGALADAIVRLVRDPALRARLGSAARGTATRRFSRERLGPEVMAAYRRVGVAI
jgi:glycosyltransferase involved in cell wall biosynthesis